MPAERSFGDLGFLDPDLSIKNTDLCALRKVAGTPEAIAAARAGDIKRLDELDLAWINAWRILPDVPEDDPRQLYEDNGWELMAFAIHRGAGPCAETLIEWSWVQPCPRCWRRLALRARCYKCSGNGWIGDDRDIFYANLDGKVLEGR